MLCCVFIAVIALFANLAIAYTEYTICNKIAIWFSTLYFGQTSSEKNSLIGYRYAVGVFSIIDNNQPLRCEKVVQREQPDGIKSANNIKWRLEQKNI